jgi:hypothetical protein
MRPARRWAHWQAAREGVAPRHGHGGQFALRRRGAPPVRWPAAVVRPFAAHPDVMSGLPRPATSATASALSGSAPNRHGLRLTWPTFSPEEQG